MRNEPIRAKAIRLAKEQKMRRSLRAIPLNLQIQCVDEKITMVRVPSLIGDL